jgi:hypothetical protein
MSCNQYDADISKTHDSSVQKGPVEARQKPASPLNVCRIYHQALIQQYCHSTVPDMAATACIIVETCISGVQLQQSLSCTQTKMKLHLHTRPALPCDILTADRAYQEYLAERIIVSHQARCFSLPSA